MKTGTGIKIAALVLLIVAAIAALVPFVWAFSTSFKTQRDAQSYPPNLIPDPFTTGNYETVLGSSSFFGAFGTSVVVTLLATVLTIVAALPCAYALVRLRMVGKPLLIVLILAVQTLPGIVLVVPLYTIAVQSGLYDTTVLLVVVYGAFLLPLATWIIATFIRAIPLETEEAARVDGATRFQALRLVILPMIRPGIATATLFTAIGAWNEFLVPVLLSESQSRPLTVYIASFVTQKTVEWGPLCAAACLVLAPVVLVVVLLQRQLIAGLNAGSLKG